MKKYLNPSILALFVANVFLSIFLYANVLEKAFFVDLPFFKSIQVVETPILFENQNYSVSNTNQYGLLGKPTTLRIPRLGLSLDLDEPIKEGDKWKVSNSRAYLLTVGKSKSGMLGDSVIFTSPSFSLFNLVTTLNEGDRFSVETDKGYLYSYRISEKIVEDAPYSIAGSETKGKVVIVEAIKNLSGKGIVITGQYESVEEKI